MRHSLFASRGTAPCTAAALVPRLSGARTLFVSALAGFDSDAVANAGGPRSAAMVQTNDRSAG